MFLLGCLLSLEGGIRMIALTLLDSLFLLSLSAVTHEPGRCIYRDRVDLIELNHYYDACGENSYHQIILWEWSPDYRRFHVVTWLLVDDDLKNYPTRLNNGSYKVTWWNSDKNCYQEVTSSLYRETFSTHDPEKENKLLFDEKFRRQLNVPQP